MDGRNNPVISIYVQNESPDDEYVFDFIFKTLNIKRLKTNIPSEANICYLTFASEITPATNSIVIQRDESHVIWTELIDDSISIPSLSDHQQFDIVNAIKFFLKDDGNRNLESSHFDEHQRLKYNKSFQYLNGIGEIPIVNRYIIFLGRLIEFKFGITFGSFYPNGKKASIILSHDVDNPGKHDQLRNFPILPKRVGFRPALKHYRDFLVLLKKFISDKQKSEFWCFDEIFEAEKKLGFKSTSFFAVVNNNSRNGDNLDVPYSIDQPRFKKVFEKMKDYGFEIALHASYNAFLDQEHFEFEKNKLASVSKSEVVGLRHHYWHLGKHPEETILKHEKAMFSYDSSIAFNDHIGFRYSCALPFNPYHSLLGRGVDVLQIPSFCMDGNLFYDPSMTVDKAVAEMSKYLDILVDHQGVGAIDWHIRTSYPNGDTFKLWGQAYLEILDALAKRDDLWVTSATDFYSWWIERTSQSS
jgi:hypothetical protein